jgi:soluble lytic murein transglycosylase-like protein
VPSFVKPLIALSAVLLGVAASPSPAEAQIYSWTDGNGHLVLSNRPSSGDKSPAPAAYVVPQAESFRATRPVDERKSALYDDLIQQYARQNSVRTDLVRAVVQVESGYNVWAQSPKGALGLMQLMPTTIQQFGVRNPFNPLENIRAGVAYLRQLLDRYANNEVLALAAYNAGPGAVDKHGQAVPPYKETRDYVSKVNKLAGESSTRRPSATTIYRVTEVVDGETVTRYTDQRPASGHYELVAP